MQVAARKEKRLAKRAERNRLQPEQREHTTSRAGHRRRPSPPTQEVGPPPSTNQLLLQAVLIPAGSSASPTAPFTWPLPPLPRGHAFLYNSAFQMPHSFRPQSAISNSHESKGNLVWFPPSGVDIPHVPDFASVCFMALGSTISGSESHERATWQGTSWGL